MTVGKRAPKVVALPNGRSKRARTVEPQPTTTPAKRTNRARSQIPAVNGSLAGTPRKNKPPPLNHPPDFRDLGPSPLHVFVFGTDDMAALGLGINRLNDTISVPQHHPWFENAIISGDLGKGGVRDLSCGGMHTLVVDDNGKVFSWGPNDDAALGRQTVGLTNMTEEEAESSPALVQSIGQSDYLATRVAAGDCVSIALNGRGLLRAWGSFKSGDGYLGFDGRRGGARHQRTPVALPGIEKKSFAQVACGTNHVLGLTTDGRVWTWGNGEQEQLGRKIIERHKTNGLTPTQLALKNIVLVGAGAYHSFAVGVNGVVWAWGLNISCQTGVAPIAGVPQPTVTTPSVVEALHPENNSGARVISIQGGDHHSVFLLDNGTVMTCGRNDDGQCGLGNNHPLVLQGLAEIAALRTKRNDRITKELAKLKKSPDAPADEIELNAMATEAAVAAVPIPDLRTPLPTLVTFPSGSDGHPPKIVDIAVGSRNSVAISEHGDAFSWGLGLNANLGLVDSDGDAIDVAKAPRRIRAPGLDTWKIRAASLGGASGFLLASSRS